MPPKRKAAQASTKRGKPSAGPAASSASARTPRPSSTATGFSLREIALGLIALLLSVAYLRFRSTQKAAATAPVVKHGRTYARHDVPTLSLEPIVEDSVRKHAVVEAFKHAWSAYERDAWGFDNHHPISHEGTNLASEGIGYFIVDCLDSLLLLGLTEEHARARKWVASLSFDVDDRFHAFEVTIRVLGGLLAAYHMTQDQLYLDKAVELGNRLLPIFETPSGLPASFINLSKGELIYDSDNYNWSSVAEVGTLQLEMRYLSHLSGDDRYWRKSEAALDRVIRNINLEGLAPLFLNATSGEFVASDIRLGSRGDSYYEYLLKLYMQSNLTEDKWRDAYDQAVDGMRKYLVATSMRQHITYTQELIARPNFQERRIEYMAHGKQDHLVCFLPGLLFLGVTHGDRSTVDPANFDSRQAASWQLAIDLLDGCMRTYTETETGLSPEITFWRNDVTFGPEDDGRDWYIDKRAPGSPPPLDARNILRPETVESLFVAYRSTGDRRYREWAWDIFQAFEKHCKLPDGGYASIRDVDEVPVVHENRMETFFLAETLKYLYLIFSDESVVPLDKNVLTTEAHILPILDL